MNARPVFRALKAMLLVAPIVALAQAPPPPPPLTPLPPMPTPLGNPVTTAKANLGKTLFWDEQLSSSRTVACGTCHRAENGGIDPRSHFADPSSTSPGFDGVLGTADDVTGSPGVQLANADGSLVRDSKYGLGPQVTGRGTMSHIDAGYSATNFWDGRATAAFLDPVTGDTLLRAGAGLESQSLAPITSSVEMGHLNRDWPSVIARLGSVTPLALSPSIPTALKTWINGRGYPGLFQEAFGTPAITPGRIAFALASYERTLVSDRAKIDSVAVGTAVLSPQAAQGQQLFGGLGCAGCHGGATFSDGIFHYDGVRPAAEDSGRFIVTRNPADLGAMKTPSLRNVALRPTFFRNGRINRLEDVIAFYNRGGDFNAPNKPPVIRPLNLTAAQQNALVTFLREALTDNRVRDRVAPFDRPALYSESALMVPQAYGSGQAGSGGVVPQVIAIQPPILGNDRFTVGLDKGFGGASATLVIDGTEPPAAASIPATGSLARTTVTLQGSGVGQGFGSATLSIPNNPALVGQTFFGRWYVADASAPGGVSWSPAFSFKVFGAGADGLLAVGSGPTLPRALQLSPGRPTPFRASTVIAYELYSAANVKLVVYDAQGRAVRRLVDAGLQLAGPYAITWDGRDDAGRAAPSGVYFYRLEAGRESSTMRAVKLD
mgnify:FL=1